MTMTTSHVAYSCNILAPAVGEDASIFQQISSRWQRSQGEAAREGAEDKPWGTGKKTQAVRGDVAAGSMPMKQPESKQKKDDKNTRYTIKAAQPAAQAQPLPEKVLSQLLAVLVAELVQPPLAESLQHKFQRRTTIRIMIIRRIAIQTPSLQPLAELKWSRQPFAEKHLSLVKVIPATAVVTTRIADSVDRVQPKKGKAVTVLVELLQHPPPGCSRPGRRDGPRSHRRPTRTLRKHG